LGLFSALRKCLAYFHMPLIAPGNPSSKVMVMSRWETAAHQTDSWHDHDYSTNWFNQPPGYNAA